MFVVDQGDEGRCQPRRNELSDPPPFQKAPKLAGLTERQDPISHDSPCPTRILAGKVNCGVCTCTTHVAVCLAVGDDCFQLPTSLPHTQHT